ncbi:MAG: Trm112 family protein [Thermoprotei archaeon]|nr:MAG: Trm112 family protein [Thermoprotei archaeon]
MKYRLMDLLACPICKRFPLQLVVFQENLYEKPERIPSRTCEEYCGWLRKWVKEGKGNCHECFAREVAEGILICDNCGRWYPIIEEIPHMLPDDLRDAKEDRAFLEKWRDKIPSRVLTEGKPFNLSSK